ncbi:hypothetical protein FHS44_002209 [Streptosporangium saharense]|uniref:Uncharacterized protein n=1 Tax=Streptosporangium saharense TaxID=1706840 RepID=A0A7W7QKK2_9ACTN|nr:hypothetical protein [Streptosporangium saharense]
MDAPHTRWGRGKTTGRRHTADHRSRPPAQRRRSHPPTGGTCHM